MNVVLTALVDIKTVVAYLYALLAISASTVYQKIVWELGKFPGHSVIEAYILPIGPEKDEVTWQPGQPCLNGADQFVVKGSAQDLGLSDLSLVEERQNGSSHAIAG